MKKENLILILSCLTVLSIKGGEITPIDAVASSLATNDNVSNIYDKSTKSLACTQQGFKYSWFQANLDKVYCIATVLVQRFSWNCTFTVTNNSSIEETEDCRGLMLKVFNRSAESPIRENTVQPPHQSGCLLGDSVKVVQSSGSRGSICVRELTITELKDCDTSSLVWNHLSTDKHMSVNHGARLVVECERGFFNIGGHEVECLDGELVPLTEPPNCALTKKVKPIAVNQSSSPSDVYNAESAIDGDLDTQSCTGAEKRATSWWQAKFEEVYCISEVIVLRSGYKCTFSFDCGKVYVHPVEHCTKLSLQIHSQNVSMPRCVFGNSVLLQMTASNMQLCVKEIIFRIANPEGELRCCMREPDWPNMKIGANLPVRHGEVLPVSCKPGYRSTEDGESNVRCFNGTIKADKEQQLPICLADCEENSFEKDGIVAAPSLPVQHGTKITFNCTTGFNNFGGKHGFCNNGTISPTENNPQCFENCEENDLPSHLTTELRFPVAHQTTMSVSCLPGYSISRSREVMCENGKIVTAHGNLPDCLADCVENRSTQDGVVTEPSLPVQHGINITFNCTRGYSNFGSKTGFCNNGTISPTEDIPRCYADCVENRLTKDGVVTEPSLPVQHDANITFNCTTGYSNIGSKHGFCNNGTIFPTKDIPRCYADCAENSFAKYGVVTEPSLPVQHGINITFNCTTGYSNIGSKHGFCNNGTISPARDSPGCYGMIVVLFCLDSYKKLYRR